MFYIINQGLKMTAMPAWGKSRKPDQIWDTVTFLQKLPELTPEHYEAMTAATGPDAHGQDHEYVRTPQQKRCGGDG